jgi:Na+/melibiose symporter-like transporter
LTSRLSKGRFIVSTSNSNIHASNSNTPTVTHRVCWSGFIMGVPLAFGIASFSASAMQSLFITHYVSLYMNVYHIQPAWFFFGEMVFLLWNSINDPLFGYFARGWSVRRRVNVLDGPAALWVLSFAMFFMLPLPSSSVAVGVHFVVCLCLYDGFLSYVLLIHASLLADLSSSVVERASANSWSSAFSIGGSLSVFFSNLYFDETNVDVFRMFCILVAFLSLVAFQISYTTLARVVEEGDKRSAHFLPTSSGANNDSLSVHTFASQLKSHRNFWLFVVVNLIQVFNCKCCSYVCVFEFSKNTFRSF